MNFQIYYIDSHYRNDHFQENHIKRENPRIHLVIIFVFLSQKCQPRLEIKNLKISRNSAYILRESETDIEQCGAL